MQQIIMHPHALLREIVRFCARNDMAESRFGRAALNDPALVCNLRAGRHPRPKTMARIRSFLAKDV